MRLWPTLPGTPHTAAGQHGLQPAGPRVILVSIGEVPARSWGEGGGSAMVSAQRLLFCLCGDIPAVAGFCRRCYGRLARSRRRFAGSRETVLDRDGRQCQACGGQGMAGRAPPPAGLPRSEAPDHRLRRLPRAPPPPGAVRRWIPEALAPLWAEQHPGVGEQRNRKPV